jgi:hypothetical protein
VMSTLYHELSNATLNQPVAQGNQSGDHSCQWCGLKPSDWRAGYVSALISASFAANQGIYFPAGLKSTPFITPATGHEHFGTPTSTQRHFCQHRHCQGDATFLEGTRIHRSPGGIHRQTAHSRIRHASSRSSKSPFPRRRTNQSGPFDVLSPDVLRITSAPQNQNSPRTSPPCSVIKPTRVEPPMFSLRKRTEPSASNV